MEKDKIERLNALARKKKAEGLTGEEIVEQMALRKQYLEEVRENFKQQLESIRVEGEDGEYHPLEKKDDAPGGMA